MPDTCEKCGSRVALTSQTCAVCNTPHNYPNVKVAGSAQEADALTSRYVSAFASASARRVTTELTAFESAVATASQAVMNRSLGALSNWLNADNPMFYSFQHQVLYGGRVVTDSEWDLQRGAAEATINPVYSRDLNYAALTLDGHGMFYYGPYAVSLKTVTIEHRASVFEQNPFLFCKTHHVISGQAPPAGYRAPWSDRGRLAAAKLQPSIRPGCAGDQFPEVLMERKRGESDCDYVEVHIFGPVNRLGIERIVGPKPTDRIERQTWKQVVRKAKELGVVVEETA